MGTPEIKGYASYSNYYSLSDKSNEGLALIGGKTDFTTGTTISVGVGNDCITDKNGHSKNKHAMEFKAVQKLGNIDNISFNAQSRIRFIDGKTQIRGTLGGKYSLNNGIIPYVSGHYTYKEGVSTTGGWIGCSYKNVSAEIQGNYNLQDKKTNFLINFMVNI